MITVTNLFKRNDSPTDNNVSGTLACLQFFKRNWQLFLGLAMLIALVLILIFSNTATSETVAPSNYKQQSALNNVLADFEMLDAVPEENIDGYYLKNNRLTDFTISGEAPNKTVNITAVHTSTAVGYTNKRNTHFYDVCDLITKQGITPANGFSTINYVVTNRKGEQQMSFIVDSDMMLDILDGYITYKTLYQYVIDLYMTKEFQ